MKILLISYWFSPATVIGAKRWGEFYVLSQNNASIEMEVLTANWQGKKENTGVYYIGNEIKSIPFYSINKPIGYVDMFNHPSLMIRSIDRSVNGEWYKKSKEWIDEHSFKKYDLVISSFGPIASVLLGRYAKKTFNIPHIVDLRDLISIQGQKSKFLLINFLDKQIDKYITKDVDSFLVVSPTGNKKARNFYKKEVFTIYNGFSKKIENKYINLSLKEEKNINILYMGTLGINRNPHKILVLLNEYAKLHKDRKICINFASQDDPLNFIYKEKLAYIEVTWLGYLEKELLELEKQKSNVFLLLEDLTSKGNENLTGKIFEYLQTHKPIMVSCHKGSDIVKLLDKTNAGRLIETLDDVHTFFNISRELNIDETNFYTRENQYKELKKILKSFNV